MFGSFPLVSLYDQSILADQEAVKSACLSNKRE